MQLSATIPRARPFTSYLTSWLTSRKLHWLALATVLVVAAVFTGVNLFHFPHYESDEGTYMGSAWAMFKQAKLSYYTYNYDHPPLGWALIGLWTTLIGGFTEFGSAVNAGRTLMWVVTIASALLLYVLVRRATGRMAPGVLASVLFVVSPLGLDLHRQVWLDNLSTLFLLASLYALLRGGTSLTWVMLSGVLFSAAFWTKEISVVFLPGMLYLTYALSARDHRRFSLALWLGLTFTGISTFVLLSLLKDEFLPPGVLWSSDGPHVSLLQTYLWQAGRGTVDGDIGAYFSQWAGADPLVIVGGLVAAGLGIVFGRRDPFMRGVAVLSVTYALFLARGGVVLYYYVIPLIALLALAIGLGTARLGNWLASWRVVRWSFGPLILACTVLVGENAFHADTPSFNQNQTASQNDATAWMMANLPSNSVILMDSYNWVNMRDPDDTQGQPFDNAHYYWPGVSDPSVRSDLLHDDWRNIDYLAFSPSLQADIAGQDLPLVPEAMQNADEVRTFTSDNWSVTILRVRKLHEMQAPDDPVLAQSWASYDTHFIDGGRVVDPSNGQTTSEGQSYALLRAVYMGDRATFDQVLGWTGANLQDGSDLPTWDWGTRADGSQGVLDPNTAADADEQIALALLFASRQWQDPEYESQALSMMQAIWDQETVPVGDQRVLVAGNWARGDADSGSDAAVVNPSYFAPYAYRIFADADPEHDWMGLVNSSYDLLANVRSDADLGGSAGVVPNWVAVDTTTGALSRADMMGDQAAQFSFDASRLPWQLALDWLWFKDDRAKEAMQGINLPERELAANGQLSASYDLDGAPTADYEATSMYGGTLAGLLFADDQSLVHKVFAAKILGTFNDQNGDAYWGNPTNYYDQNWGWFATALMDGSMSNLWAGQTTLDWDDGLVPSS